LGRFGGRIRFSTLRSFSSAEHIFFIKEYWLSGFAGQSLSHPAGGDDVMALTD